jgi:enoyl-CoA hydratase/carnithine racemase
MNPVVLLSEKNGPVTTITLNRPEAMNAFNREMAEELGRAWAEFAADPDAMVLLITGSGDKAFCVGADLHERARLEDDPHVAGFWNGLPGQMPMRSAEMYKPVIAAINGHCLGGGLELALLCDIRIASENASFGQPEIRWGIFPGMGATQRLPRVLPYNLAAEMLFTGERMNAAEAYRVGLINRVVPQGQLMIETGRVAETIVRNGPLALRAAKEALLRSYDLSMEQGLRLEGLLRHSVGRTEDAREGIRAFREKRTPRYRGR